MYCNCPAAGRDDPRTHAPNCPARLLMEHQGPIPLDHPAFAMGREAVGPRVHPAPDEVHFNNGNNLHLFMQAVNKANALRDTSIRWIYPIGPEVRVIDGILYGLTVEAVRNDGLGPSKTFSVNIPADISARDFGAILDEAMPPVDGAPPKVEVTLDIIRQAREKAEARYAAAHPAPPEPDPPPLTLWEKTKSLAVRIGRSMGRGGQ